MLRLRKDDVVQVVKGEDRGKKGRVLKILPGAKRAIVEGINLVKKHKRKTQQDQQGGVVSVESSISLANLMLFCKHCNHTAKVAVMLLKDGTKSRICRACKEAI